MANDPIPSRNGSRADSIWSGIRSVCQTPTSTAPASPGMTPSTRRLPADPAPNVQRDATSGEPADQAGEPGEQDDLLHRATIGGDDRSRSIASRGRDRPGRILAAAIRPSECRGRGAEIGAHVEPDQAPRPRGDRRPDRRDRLDRCDHAGDPGRAGRQREPELEPAEPDSGPAVRAGRRHLPRPGRRTGRPIVADRPRCAVQAVGRRGVVVGGDARAAQPDVPHLRAGRPREVLARHRHPHRRAPERPAGLPVGRPRQAPLHRQRRALDSRHPARPA